MLFISVLFYYSRSSIVKAFVLFYYYYSWSRV